VSLSVTVAHVSMVWALGVEAVAAALLALTIGHATVVGSVSCAGPQLSPGELFFGGAEH